jgi:hypothetical protein
MAQRSLHAFTKVNPSSYVLLCHKFPLVGNNRIPSGPFHSCEGYPLLGTTEYPRAPLAPCGLIGIAMSVSLFQQDKLTRAFLISQQVVLYWTRAGTCCPGVSTPTIRSLADSSMTIHITWQNPTVSTITNLAQTIASIITTVKSHLDGWETKHSHKDTSQTHDCRAKQIY